MKRLSPNEAALGLSLKIVGEGQTFTARTILYILLIIDAGRGTEGLPDAAECR